MKSSTVVQLRTAPSAVGLVAASVGISPEPISASSTVPTAAATMQCAHGYSGCIGVSMNGVHAGSRSVAGFAVVVAIADGGDRPPEVVVVLGVEDGDQRIVRCLAHGREEAGVLSDLAPGGGGDRDYDLV